MSTNKFWITIAALVILVPIVNNIQLDKAAANPTTTESATELDRRKTQEALSTPSQEDLRRDRQINQIANSWEKTVDAAGLHTLLNKNTKIYTLLRFDFYRKMEMSAKRKLFAPENQADLQRIVKCHVVPHRFLKTTIPKNSTVVLETMENGCTVKVRGEFIEDLVPEVKYTTQWSQTCDTMRGCSSEANTIAIKTGRMLEMNSAKIWIDGEKVEEAPNGGGGMYIPYKIYKMKMPPDLQVKYDK